MGVEENLRKRAEMYHVPYEKEVLPIFRTYKEHGATDVSAFKSTLRDLENTYGLPEESTEVPAKQGLNADDYLKRAASGNWLTAELVNEGDRLVLLEGIREDSETFERPYIVAPVKLADEEYDLRLGVRNVKRLRDAFGPNMSKWVGREVEVAAIENYKVRGAQQKGLILRGVKEPA